MVQAAQAGRTIPSSLPSSLKESSFGNTNLSSISNYDNSDVLASLVSLPTISKPKSVGNAPNDQKPKTRSLGSNQMTLNLIN